jgi:clan AA aspartic protease (TIGR02281 family)
MRSARLSLRHLAVAACLLAVLSLGTARAQTLSPDATRALEYLAKSPKPDIKRLAQQLQGYFCNQPAVQQEILLLHADLDFKPGSDLGDEFLAKCDKDPAIGFLTMQGWYRLTNFNRALATINQFKNEIASDANFASWRGFVLEKLNRNLDAAADLERSLYLFVDIKNVAGSQFYYVTKNLEAAGRYCEAIHPMELYLSFDTEKRRTTEYDSIVSRLQQLGKCPADIPAGSTAIRLRQQGGLLLVDGVINGTRAVFVLDTGASMVHLTRAFASKAGIKFDEDNRILTRGVTGSRYDFLTKIEKLEIGKVVAHDVSVTVASESYPIGAGVDGLLGETFLSRYKVHIDAGAKTLSLSARN